jgi:hypothetical protein
VNFATPYTSPPMIAITVKQAGSLILCVNAVSDNGGLDVWIAAPDFPHESPYPYAAQFFWIATPNTQ